MELNVTKEVIKLYTNESLSIPKLMKILGISRYMIEKLAKKENLKRSRRRFPNEYNG